MAAEHEEMEKEIYKRFAEKDYETPESSKDDNSLNTK